MTKNTLLGVLLCANIALAAGILLQTTSPKSALAQVTTGLAGDYLVVAGEVQDQFDAVYLLDVKTQYLHALTWDRGKKELEYVGSRKLDRDFRNN